MSSHETLFSDDAEMSVRLKNFDWREHDLGDPAGWSATLVNAVAMCLAAKAPMQLVWGPSQTIIYNDAAIPLLGALHPTALARRAPDIGGAHWSAIREAVDRVFSAGVAINQDGASLRPLIEHDGSVAGVLCAMPIDMRNATLTDDLRDPLTLIMAALDDLLATTDEPIIAPREDLERVRRGATMIAELLGVRDVDSASDVPVAARQLHDSAPVGTRTPGRAQILVVDDNDDVRDYITHAFEDEWSIVQAENGAVALRMALENPPDLVIADVMMPELDGVALTRALRGNPRTSQVPVILATARTGDEARAAGREAGADDYIVKPFTLRELRARVRMLLELTRIRHEAQQSARRAKDDFLAMIGHELRNPLSTVWTSLQALLLRTPSPEVAVMDRAVRHLTRLVDDLLESSRLARGTIALQRKPVELAQVVDRAMEIVADELEPQHKKVVVTVPRVGWRVDGDAERLARAIGNVLMNAAQHSAAGARISIEVDRAADHVQLRVVDQGSGIAADQLGTIFSSFQEGLSPQPRASGGLGLGLAIARGVVELHGGSIEVASAGLGLGTTCTLRLPTTGAAALEPIKATSRTARKRLLLVEDNDDAARALKAALEQLGYEVALAHNGPLALNLARSFNPDVALLDLGLPVMDGWELARRLRSAESELPIVAVTARDQQADKEQSEQLGFADHLVKPINLSQLERIVESLPDRNTTNGSTR